MRINPYSNQKPVDSVSTGPTSNRAKTNSSASVTSTGEADGFSRSTALSGLISSIRDLPETRSDVISNVQAKIAAGELSTQAAYAEAATNIDDLAKK